MNICMLSTNRNAAGSRVMMQAAGLRSAGYRVVVIEPLTPGRPALDVVQGTQVFRIPVRPARYAIRNRPWPAAGSFARRATRVAASLHARVIHVVGLEALAAGCRIAARVKARVVLDVAPDTRRTGAHYPRHDWLRPDRTRLCLVLAPDAAALDRMARQAPRIPLALVQTRFPRLDPPPSVLWPVRYGLGPDHGLLFVPLDAHTVTGARSLLAALERLPARVHAVFASCGSKSVTAPAFSETVRSAAGRTKRLEGRVHMAHFADREAMVAEASSARLGCVVECPTAVQENPLSQTPLLHCLAARLPVVVPDRPDYRSLVDRYGCGEVVDMADRWALARSISRPLDSNEHHARLQENARRAGSNECWERELEILVKSYERHVGPPAHTTAASGSRSKNRVEG